MVIYRLFYPSQNDGIGLYERFLHGMEALLTFGILFFYENQRVHLATFENETSDGWLLAGWDPVTGVEASDAMQII